MSGLQNLADATGRQKAAILLLALGEEQCTKLFGMMQDHEIREVSSAMSQLGPIKAEIVERLCSDFTDNLGGQAGLVGSFEATERLLLRAMPRERAAHIMEEIRGPVGRRPRRKRLPRDRSRRAPREAGEAGARTRR